MNSVTDHAFRLKRFILGAEKVRRTRFYCVGMAKSGTHSIHSMFSRNVAAAHEPQALSLIEKFFDRQENRITAAEFHAWLVARDRELSLEVDSSWFNVLILDFLVREFPQARFLLTIRDCYSWLNSEFKRVLRQHAQDWQRVKLREFIYKPAGAAYSPLEKILQDAGLFPIEGYLARWTAHNEKVLAAIPADRLLVVRTHEIRLRAFEIADFARLPRHAVRLTRAYDFKNPVGRNLIHEFDRDFLEQKISQHCRPLMAKFFPEIKSLDDAAL
ncbi:MAG: sulfotransferase [Limisphaerales bacterium]